MLFSECGSPVSIDSPAKLFLSRSVLVAGYQFAHGEDFVLIRQQWMLQHRFNLGNPPFHCGFYADTDLFGHNVNELSIDYSAGHNSSCPIGEVMHERWGGGFRRPSGLLLLGWFCVFEVLPDPGFSTLLKFLSFCLLIGRENVIDLVSDLGFL